MHIFDLPLEVLEQIMQQAVLSAPTQALTLRHVSRAFSHETTKAISTIVGTEWARTGKRPREYGQPTSVEQAARILYQATTSRAKHTAPLFRMLQRVTKKLMTVAGARDDGARTRFLAAACACAVAWHCRQTAGLAHVGLSALDAFEKTPRYSTGWSPRFCRGDIAYRATNEVRHACFAVAAWMGDVRLLQAFCMQSCYMDIASPFFCSPFGAAARQGHLRVIRFLLSRGLDFAEHHPRSPAAYTHSSHHFYADSPFTAACCGGQDEIVRFFIIQHNFPNAEDMSTGTQISLIAKKNHVGVLCFLIQHFKIPNRELKNALDAAMEAGATASVMALLDYLPPTISPSILLIDAAHLGFLDLVKALLDRGADPSFCAPTQGTPVWFAARYGRVLALAALLDAIDGSDSRISASTNTNNRGTTPAAQLALATAIEYDQLPTVELLLRRGFNPHSLRVCNITSGALGRLAMQQACRHGRVDILLALAAFGCDVHASFCLLPCGGAVGAFSSMLVARVPHAHLTPLQVARLFRQREAVVALRDLGVDMGEGWLGRKGRGFLVDAWEWGWG